MTTVGYMITGVISMIYLLVHSIVLILVYGYDEAIKVKRMCGALIILNMIVIVYVINSLYVLVR